MYGAAGRRCRCAAFAVRVESGRAQELELKLERAEVEKGRCSMMLFVEKMDHVSTQWRASPAPHPRLTA